MQKEKMQELKKNVNQQKMLNKVLSVTNDSIKKEFPVFAKLVQADVANAILQYASKDGRSLDEMTILSKTINEMVSQVGKDLEKQMLNKFVALKEGSTK